MSHVQRRFLERRSGSVLSGLITTQVSEESQDELLEDPSSRDKTQATERARRPRSAQPAVKILHRSK